MDELLKKVEEHARAKKLDKDAAKGKQEWLWEPRTRPRRSGAGTRGQMRSPGKRSTPSLLERERGRKGSKGKSKGKGKDGEGKGGKAKGKGKGKKWGGSGV